MNITPSGFIRPAVYCDPVTYDLLNRDVIQSPVSDFLGVPVHVQSQGKEFVPPYDRFVEYECSDYPWMMALGIGCFEEVRYLYVVDMAKPSADFTIEMLSSQQLNPNQW